MSERPIELQQQLALQREVASALTEAASRVEGVQSVIRAIGDRCGWMAGSFWRLDPPTNLLQCQVQWRSTSPSVPAGPASPAAAASAGTLAGTVWASKQAVWIADLALEREPARAEEAATGEFRSAVAFPVAAGGTLVGVIELYGPAPRPLEPALLAVLVNLGQQVGVYLKLKQAEEDLTERARWETLRLEISEALTGVASLANVLQACTDSLVTHLAVAFARIWVLPRAGDELELRASSGLYTHLDGAHGRIKLGELKIGRLAKNRRPYLTNDVAHDAEIADQSWADREGIVAFAGYPLVVGKHVVGVMAMFAKHPLAATVLHEIKPLADAIAVFIDREAGRQALLESEERSRLLLESSGDGIYGIDLQGRCTFANRQTVTLLGYHDASELLGKSPHEMFHHSRPDGSPHPLAKCKIERVLHETARAHADDEVFWRPDGSSFPVEYRANEVISGGVKIGAVVTFTDITARRRSEHDTQLREQALRSIAQGVFITDPKRADEPITYVNHSFEQITGYSLREVRGRPIEFICGRDTDTAAVRAIGEAYREKRESEIELLCYRKDEAPFWATLSIAPVKRTNDAVTHFVGVLTDVSERKRTADQLLEAKELAEAANIAKSQFLAGMSHELRTPLNAVIMYSELLQEEAEDRGISDFVPDLEKIRNGGKHLLSLINGVLDLSKIEAGKMELSLETFDIKAMIEEIADTVRPLVEKNDNRLEPECADNLGEMLADLTKTRQVLFNLVSNACKFTQNGLITLAASREKDQMGSWIVFQLTDTGIGMTAEQAQRVFAPFIQADASTTRKYGGTGLGLAICKQFCEMMGGTIAVGSEPGKGSSFTVRLPVRVAPTAAPGEAESPGVPAGTATVLVIDDEASVRDFVARSLVADNVHVVTAPDGPSGLELATKLKPAVILLDVMMPRMDGWAVLSALKANPELANTPVVMMTIVGESELGYLLGASEYLAKPIERDRLITLVKKHHVEGSPAGVLIVDDDEPTRHVIRRTLAKQGWSVAEAPNGRVGLERVAQNPPVLILLDLMMPDMDGFEFVAELRKNEAWRNIPVVILTSKDLTVPERRKLSGNVETILQKGAYGREALLRELRRVVAQYAGVSPKP